MFQLRAISARLVLAFSLVIALTCGILGEFSALQQRSLLRLALDQQLRQQFDSVTAAIEYEGRAALAVGGAIAALPPVAAAIGNGDRDALVALLAGPAKTLQAQGIPRFGIISPPATIFVRPLDPATHGDDISGRRPTVVLVNRTGNAMSGVEMGPDALATYATTPVMRDGKSLAVVDIGVAFGKEFVDRLKQRFAIDLAVHSFTGGEFRTLASTFGAEHAATPGELRSALDGTALRRDATFQGHSVALYIGRINNYSGQPVAVIELIKDTTDYESIASGARRNLIIATSIILCVGILLALALGRGLSRPLTAITATMHRLAGGDTAVTIPGSDRSDELGTMAKAVDVFRQSMIETNRLASQQLAEHDVKDKRAAALMSLTMNFEDKMSALVRVLGSSSSDLQSTARTMAATSENTTLQVSTVAVASQQATASASSVASATEELSASIQEVSQQVTRSSILIQDAVSQANQSTEQVLSLIHI